MATLVLQAAGQAAGGLLGPVGAMVGRAAGAIAGSVVDRQLFSSGGDRSVGQLDDLSVQTSSEGNPIPRVYGRNRLAGEVIWATTIEETVSETSGGGKGSGSTVHEYSYFASFAVGVCEGPVARIGRIWADGELLDVTRIEMRVYTGTQTQEPDPLIEATEGVAPAYRGLAYVVLERLPIGEFGNRLPQLTFEVIRPVGALEQRIKAVTMIPGATEFGYDPRRVDRQIDLGESEPDNRHTAAAATDFEASLDELLQLCPNLERVALVVSWFGSDLRASECALYPGVEARERNTSLPWSVAGQTRATARLVSAEGGRVAYGGTPSDASVVAAIEAIRARGLKVVFYPFILMDVPASNNLPDPYGAETQAPFPWRGRITLSSAPGRADSPDQTPMADIQVAAFVGTASPVSMPDGEWSYRRMIMHYAHLVEHAGGVDAFLIGSELRGLTTLRGASGFPFVDALCAIADDVRTIVGPSTKISYAADWSEYFGYQPAGGDVYFHLDRLWAHSNINFIGIDNYWPLSDWREGEHLDSDVAQSEYDHDYLTANVAGGEGYDWYYESSTDRDAQVRRAITDGAYGKDWVFRYKDLASWWTNEHFERIGSVEQSQSTDWIPRQKPVWFTEVGCPAVQFGSNQPNVFYDPKSSESALPYYSNGRRDDAIQRAYLLAIVEAFDPAFSSDIDRYNPVSSVYGGRMVDPAGVHAWTWDARPWPEFPHRMDVWTDGGNWERGHWLNGRLGGAPFSDLVEQLFRDWGYEPPDVEGVSTVLDGFMIGRSDSLRSVLEPLTEAVSAVGADTGTGIRFVGLNGSSRRTFERRDLVDGGDGAPLVSETRQEAFELPEEVRIRYYDSGRTFRLASARYRPSYATPRQIDEITLAASMSDGLANELAEQALAVRWGGRVMARFALPPCEAALMPGDIVTLNEDGIGRDFIIEEIEDLEHREINARSIDRSALQVRPSESSYEPERLPSASNSGSPYAFALNLPVVDEKTEQHLPWLAVYAKPFNGPYGVWRAPEGGTFQLLRTVERPASAGEVLRIDRADQFWRMDRASSIDVRILSGTLTSVEEIDVFSGSNTIAVHAGDGFWEILQFQTAELVADRTYRLTNLLRGQLGTEDAAVRTINPGAEVAVLDGTLATIPISRSEIGLERVYRVGPLVGGVGGEATTTFKFTSTGRGLAPYSPVHPSARRRANGDILISWIPRPRLGGDAWLDGSDNLIVESAEYYTLSIKHLGNVLLEDETTEPSYIYDYEQQIIDFNVPPDFITLRIAQISPGLGAGPVLEESVDVQ